MTDNHIDRPKFDPTINWGHILQILVIVVGGIAAVYTLSSRVSSLEFVVTELKENVKSLTTLMITSARQEERITFQERRIDRLELLVKKDEPGR